MTFVHVIVTNWGELKAPEWFVEKHRRAKRRKDGSVDRRTNLGREVLKDERELISAHDRQFTS